MMIASSEEYLNIYAFDLRLLLSCLLHDDRPVFQALRTVWEPGKDQHTCCPQIPDQIGI